MSRILRRNWKWIVGGSCACAIGALLVSLFLPKTYRSTTFLLVSESKIGDPSRDSNLQQMAMLPTFIPFVDNDALIDESLKKLGLDAAPHALTVDLFRRRNYMDVRTPKSTRLLELRIEFPDARLAAALANEIARGAVRFNDRLNKADTVATQEFLKAQLDQARAFQVESSTRRLKILDRARIEDREKDLAILLAEKEQLSSQLQQLRLELVQNQGRSRSLEQTLEKEPEVISLKRSVTSDRFIEVAAQRVFPQDTPLEVTEEAVNETREGIRQTYVNATVNIAAQSAGIEAATRRLAQVNEEIPDLIREITALRGEIEGATNDYALAVEATKNASREYQAASVTVSSKSQDIRQIAPALVPVRPVGPMILFNTLMGLLLGLLLFGGLALAIENYREAHSEPSFTDGIEVIRAAGVHRH
jgi:uncharacterized protein involved in exopolysaccharide biosynthesis